MVYTVYKVTNIVNKKYYVGVHKTTNPYDKYMGSGKLIKQAIAKHGLDNFTKEILHIFETADEAYAVERVLVDESVVNAQNSYNLIIGGIPTADWSEERKQHYRDHHKPNLGKKLSEEHKRKISNASRGRRQSEVTKQKHREARLGKPSHNKGKTQTDESNAKRSAAHLNLIKVSCTHCNKLVSPQNAKRWHFEACKLLPK